MPGNKRVYTAAEYATVMALVAQGKSLNEIEKATGVGRGAVYRMRAGKWQGKATSRALTGRAQLTTALAGHLDAGHELDELTVLTVDNDPFRQDTEVRHQAAAWLVSTAATVGIDFTGEHRTVHLRGLHYALLGQPRPDGQPYANTYEQWCWLYGTAAKAARWLGYVRFSQIIDQRNAEPVIYEAPAEPWASVAVPVDDPAQEWEFTLPDAEEFTPVAKLGGNIVHQPNRIALVGEKSSLEPVLGPLARQYYTDLYLPTGEISETQVHRMASTAARDGRPLVVLYFADCDPAGWQMGVSVGRKLQAFRELLGGFEFSLYRVALVPGQVRELDLPSTPLKEGERRAGKWQDAMGVEQTEVDALMALRPGELDRIAREAIGQFRDATLARRAYQAREQWEAEAQQVISDGMTGDPDELAEAAQAKLDQAAELVTEARESLATTAGADDLPEFTAPEPELPEPEVTPLVSSGWDFAEQCRALRESKAYGGDEDE